MTNKKFWLGIIALSVIVGFSMTACKDDEGGLKVIGGGGSNVTITPTSLTLAGKVFLLDITDEGYIYNAFNDNLTVETISGFSGSVTNGNLNFTIGVPNNLDGFNSFFYNTLLDDIIGDWDNLTTSPPSVNCFVIDDLDTEEIPVTPSHGYSGLALVKDSINGSWTNGSIVRENVVFIYVENSVTISGTGKTGNYDDDVWETKSFNIQLTTGWNAICCKNEYSWGASSSEKVAISKMDSIPNSFTWIMGEYQSSAPSIGYYLIKPAQLRKTFN